MCSYESEHVRVLSTFQATVYTSETNIGRLAGFCSPSRVAGLYKRPGPLVLQVSQGMFLGLLLGVSLLLFDCDMGWCCGRWGYCWWVQTFLPQAQLETGQYQNSLCLEAAHQNSPVPLDLLAAKQGAGGKNNLWWCQGSFVGGGWLWELLQQGVAQGAVHGVAGVAWSQTSLKVSPIGWHLCRLQGSFFLLMDVFRSITGRVCLFILVETVAGLVVFACLFWWRLLLVAFDCGCGRGVVVDGAVWGLEWCSHRIWVEGFVLGVGLACLWWGVN